MSIFRSTFMSQMSLPFTFADQNFVCISHFSCVCYLLRQSYSPSFDHSNAILWSFVLHSPLAFFILVSDTLVATVLPNALCLLSSLDAGNQSSGPYKWVFMWGMERRDSEHFFFNFGSQILDLPNISTNLLGVLSFGFVVFNGGGTWSCI